MPDIKQVSGVEQVATPQYNATHLQGRKVSPDAPSDGQTPVWNATANRWEPASAVAAGAAAAPSFVALAGDPGNLGTPSASVAGRIVYLTDVPGLVAVCLLTAADTYAWKFFSLASIDATSRLFGALALEGRQTLSSHGSVQASTAVVGTSSGSNLNCALPAVASNTGRFVWFFRLGGSEWTGTASLTLTPQSGESINGGAADATFPITSGRMAYAYCDGARWQVVVLGVSAPPYRGAATKSVLDALGSLADGQLAFCTDGISQDASTGVPVYYRASKWRVYGLDTEVTT